MLGPVNVAILWGLTEIVALSGTFTDLAQIGIELLSSSQLKRFGRHGFRTRT